MKNIDQVADFILERIGCINDRPMMYGGSPEGVDLILGNYHELWAEMNDKQQVYRTISREVHDEQGCDAMGFATRGQRNTPDASPREIAKYVVTQWRKISRRLEMPIPYA